MTRRESFFQQWSIPTQTGWIYLTTGGTGEGVFLQEDHAQCIVGGFVGGHTAFIKRDVIADLGAPLISKITIDYTFFLPSDFYTQHEGTIGLLEWNNEPSGGFGSSDANHLDCFLSIHSDQTPRLVFRDNTTSLEPWTGTQLAAGKLHNVVIEWTPGKTTQGSWSVNVNNGEQEGGATGVQTVPSAILAADIEITRVLAGLPDAAIQDNNVLQVNVYDLQVRAWIDDPRALPVGWWANPANITTPTPSPVIPPIVYNLHAQHNGALVAIDPWYWDGAAWKQCEPLVNYYDGAAWRT